MTKYRKKPVVIEAEQWFPGRKVAGVEPMVGTPSFYGVVTINGIVGIEPGEWIITGVAGEQYPCKPDIFEKTYEKVD